MSGSVAAQRFHHQAYNSIDPVYVCVTTGTNRRFLRLRGSKLDIDIDQSLISHPDRILGVLRDCCGVSL